MPDTSVDTVKPGNETKPKPRNKKGFREPTSLHVDPKLWQEVRIMAVLKNVSVTEYFEDALRKKLDIDNLEIGRQGYQVGHGGMYIPPPPASTSTSQSQQSRKPPEEEILKEADEISEELEYDYQLTIPGLSFPIDKKGLLQIMREVQNEFNKRYDKVPLEVENALFLIEKLEPNKTYRGSLGLKDDLDILVSDKKIVEKLIGIPERLPGCSVVHTDPISEWDNERWERRMREDGEDRRSYQERKQQYKKQKQPEELYELKDEKWSEKQWNRKTPAFYRFLGKIKDEHKIQDTGDAAGLIMKRKDLLKKLTDEMGTDDETRIYYMLKDLADRVDVDTTEQESEDTKKEREK